MGGSPHSRCQIRSSAVLRARECGAVFGAARYTSTHSFRWQPGRASFRTTRGNNPMAADVVAQHEFTSGVPTPGSERVRMNLYYFRYAPEPPRKDVEVVIERFQYLP